MTKEKQRLAIAEACPNLDWWKDNEGAWHFSNGKTMWNGDILQDLNAMHAAEKTLDRMDAWLYTQNIWKVIRPDGTTNYDQHLHVCATAAQRAEAFLKTIGKWGEE